MSNPSSGYIRNNVSHGPAGAQQPSNDLVFANNSLTSTHVNSQLYYNSSHQIIASQQRTVSTNGTIISHPTVPELSSTNTISPRNKELNNSNMNNLSKYNNNEFPNPSSFMSPTSNPIINANNMASYYSTYGYPNPNPNQPYPFYGYNQVYNQNYYYPLSLVDPLNGYDLNGNNVYSNETMVNHKIPMTTNTNTNETINSISSLTISAPKIDTLKNISSVQTIFSPFPPPPALNDDDELSQLSGHSQTSDLNKKKYTRVRIRFRK